MDSSMVSFKFCASTGFLRQAQDVNYSPFVVSPSSGLRTGLLSVRGERSAELAEALSNHNLHSFEVLRMTGVSKGSA
jgi:hypothetical protein